MENGTKLGELWVNQLTKHVTHTRNSTAENLLLITPGGDFAKHHHALIAAADRMLAADQLVAALRTIRNQSIGSDWTAEEAIKFVKIHAGEALAAAGVKP